MIWTMLAAETSVSALDLVKVSVPGLVAGLTTLVVVFINRRFVNKDHKVDSDHQAIDVSLDQLSKQREFVIKENEELWIALRAELEHCRVEKEKLDSSLDLLRRKTVRMENELAAWELGLKTPAGFKLVKLDLKTGDLE